MSVTLSESTAKILEFAQNEARNVGATHVAALHLLLAFCNSDDKQIAAVFNYFRITARHLHYLLDPDFVLRSLAQTTAPYTPVLDSELEVALIFSQVIAKDDYCNLVHPKHLFIALLDGASDSTIELLRSLGASTRDLRLAANDGIERLPMNEVPPEDKSTEIEKVRSQIAAWQSRAEMARMQGNRDLADIALQRKSQYEKRLLELESSD